MDGRVVESSVVVLATVVVTVLVTGIPVLVGIVFPFGRFSVGAGLQILRTGVPFLLFFVGVFFLRRRLTMDGESSG